ncbi:hypothetical protein HG535_0D01470 [Zygotorulaspora mrakii]|uniref:DNA mismatch repair protein S5 domain-containing protein n=1 Tax=Zygotorulaspora mrakii TaxID=42260 RepID=A0A7H9B3A3_ZYGMR|nr:uncharacterized protein HG535_0D01470 [Zygotorulaspora mrakii]QLG72439.1 hypothetical protein HG535_0D01470 [Zygotorulaspora mrakii]
MGASIRRLDESVVNKIAAGEIIISPVNALKEMMENSIDAGATSLDVLVRDGGIKLLQISDNGSGISKEDLPILCERFTTSKLSKFEDLESIATYGFRGEALASISHIARVTITTKTAADRCAWKASYSDGKMLEPPKAVAGKDGTVILVEDLFYNMPSRLQALRSPSEEYGKILDVIGRYSIHSKSIGFSCKKFGDSQFALTVKMDSTDEDRIRTVFGNSVSKNLLDIALDADTELNIMSVKGKVSNPDFNCKRSIPPVFFINNRLVSCNPLARALRQVYSNYLPKGNKPFIHLSIMIDPKSVDVNVHPTKREVRFLHQDQIIEKINSQLNENLSHIDTSRSFKASSILTGRQLGSSLETGSKANEHYQHISATQNSGFVQKDYEAKTSKRYENKLVRTDASQSKITSFLQSNPTPLIRGSSQVLNNKDAVPNSDISNDLEEPTQVATLSSREFTKGNKSYKIVTKERVNVNLSSIKRLREVVDNSTHKELTNVFANLTYVGIADEERRLATIQQDLKLFLVDYGAVCNELFYQICLTDFCNYGSIELHSDSKENLCLVNLLIGFQHLEKDEINRIVEKIWEMRDMLLEYFSIRLESDEKDVDQHVGSIRLSGLPLLLKGYNPPLLKLPFFIYRIGTKVNWEEEELCLDGIMRQIALFYVPEIIEQVDECDQSLSEEDKITFVAKSNEMSSTLENVIFPCIKRRFLAPQKLVTDVIEIANLPGLYKVFERC